MSVSEPYELDGVTIGATEYSIPANANYSSGSPQTADGTYQLWIDPANVAKGDRFEVKVYEKTLSGATQKLMGRWTITGARDSTTYENMVFPPFMLMHGWDMTIKKLAGTDRAFDCSIRSAGAPTEFASALSSTTVSTTELSIISGTSSLQSETTDGVYQLLLDPTAMVKSDVFKVRLYEKVEGTGGVKKVFQTYLLKGLQAELFATPGFTLINGWDMTIVKVSGTDHAFSGSIRKVG